MNGMEILEGISVVALLGMPILNIVWLFILSKKIDNIEHIYWTNQFETKDILRDIKMNTVRNRELLTEGEVYDVEEARK